MKKLGVIFFVVFSLSVVIALNSVWGQEKNLWINKEVTAKIRAYDWEFFQGFDVYMVWVKGAPQALLFDIKDNDYHLASRLWGEPLSQEEIVYDIHNMNDQYNGFLWNVPFRPRAFNIVNRKGKVVGYVYTGFDSVLMDRKKDGSVIVYPPDPPTGGGGGGGAGGAGAGAGGH